MRVPLGGESMKTTPHNWVDGCLEPSGRPPLTSAVDEQGGAPLCSRSVAAKDDARLQPGEVRANQNNEADSLAGKEILQVKPDRYYPSIDSARGGILGALLDGQYLTSNEVLRRFSVSRLASDIHVLRKRGWPVRSDDIQVSTADMGRQARIARYSLPAVAISAAGPEGLRYSAEAARQETHRRSN